MATKNTDFDAARISDNEHFFHPWEDTRVVGDKERVFVSRAEGVYVYDENDNRLMDGPGGMWCVQIGYGRDEMAQAVAEQMRQVNYYSPWSFSSSPATRLAQKLADLAPGDCRRVFFTTGGSTAVDTALRFTHFRNNLLGRPDKKLILSRVGAYHGSTYLSASVSGKEMEKRHVDTASQLVHFLPSVNSYHRPTEQSEAEFLDEKINDLESSIVSLGAERVAAFIAEPFLASGGVIIPPAGYHRRTWEVCQRHDVLYISDEVVSAFGRLGHWFASEEVFGIQPDIITCAKGLTSGYIPMGACLISERVFSPLVGEGGDVFSNGYTYSGHPVSCAAALKNIEIMEKEGLMAHVRTISPHFQNRLQALRELPLVGDVRGMGLVGGVECVAGDYSDDNLQLHKTVGARIDAHCQALGLIVRPLVNMCVFSPPLVINEKQIDEMFDMLGEGIKRATEDLRKEGLF